MMRIGMLAPISWRVPPRHYGPWELVVSLLTEGLVERGFDVTLFATADSETHAKLRAVCPRPTSEDTSLHVKVEECLHVSEVFERADEFDLIHNHYDFLPLTYSALVSTPFLTTIHGFSSPRILPVYEKYNGRAHYVAISDADRSPRLDYAATIHHGILVADFTFRREPEDYLLFMGRMHPEKGAAEAIEVARNLGLPIRLAGIIHDREYFEQAVAPEIDGERVQYLGSVGPDERDRLLGGAIALLHLIRFAEPFGLAMVEAMACGTPVIARGLGSVPEIVRNGETGYIVRDTTEATEAVERAAALDRAHIRRHAETAFDWRRMVDDYVRVYQRITARPGARREVGLTAAAGQPIG